MRRYFEAHRGEKTKKCSGYYDVYERHFPKREDIRLLELGVRYGGSLQVWRAYFGPEAKIAGIDIRVRFAGEKVFKGDQADPKVLDRAIEHLGGLDIVIDDACHIAKAQIKSFDYLFPCMSEGGVYICEDLHASGPGFLQHIALIQDYPRYLYNGIAVIERKKLSPPITEVFPHGNFPTI